MGLYGVLYLRVAWRLDDGWLIIFIGWLGKVLGCIGMTLTISDEWPLRMYMVTLCNDFIWLLPFSLYLLRGTRLADRLATSSAASLASTSPACRQSLRKPCATTSLHCYPACSSGSL